MLKRLLDSHRTYYVLAGVLLVAGVLSQFELATPHPAGSAEDLVGLPGTPRNVVFIVVDTLRADHLSAYGYERATSPNLESLAAAGVRFASVEAQSTWTKASMASLWLGAYPERTGVTRYAHAVPEAARLPAEILKEAGYVTAGLWRNGWVAENFGFSQGFDVYQKPIPSQSAERMERHTPSSSPLVGTDLDATENALEFLRTRSRERFFLYVHYMDVHQYLYDEGSALFGAEYLDAYDNAIHWVDRNIGILVNGLAQRGLLDDTIVAVVSDHGEEFFEHGTEGHARNLYRETVETPWILLLPFRLASGVVVEPTVRNVDVWPTLLDLLGLPGIPGAEGRSVWPLVLAEAGVGPEPVGWPAPSFSQLDRSWGQTSAEPRPVVSVRDGPQRLIRDLTGRESVQLYDRRDDAEERFDIASERPEDVERLSERIDEFLAQPPAPWGDTPEVEVDAMRLHQLRALGYAVE